MWQAESVIWTVATPKEEGSDKMSPIKPTVKNAMWKQISDWCPHKCQEDMNAV